MVVDLYKKIIKQTKTDIKLTKALFITSLVATAIGVGRYIYTLNENSEKNIHHNYSPEIYIYITTFGVLGLGISSKKHYSVHKTLKKDTEFLEEMKQNRKYKQSRNTTISTSKQNI